MHSCLSANDRKVGGGEHPGACTLLHLVSSTSSVALHGGQQERAAPVHRSANMLQSNATVSSAQFRAECITHVLHVTTTNRDA